jgi:hypothetical protein
MARPLRLPFPHVLPMNSFFHCTFYFSSMCYCLTLALGRAWVRLGSRACCLARPEGRNYHLMRLEERNHCVEKKAPKPFSPRSAPFNRADAGNGRAAQLARPALSFVEGLRQGPPLDLSVSPVGRSAGGWVIRKGRGQV